MGVMPPYLGENLPPKGGFTSQNGCVKESLLNGLSVTFFILL